MAHAVSKEDILGTIECFEESFLGWSRNFDVGICAFQTGHMRSID